MVRVTGIPHGFPLSTAGQITPVFYHNKIMTYRNKIITFGHLNLPKSQLEAPIAQRCAMAHLLARVAHASLSCEAERAVTACWKRVG
jgi:hypothetical protein